MEGFDNCHEMINMLESPRSLWISSSFHEDMMMNYDQGRRTSRRDVSFERGSDPVGEARSDTNPFKKNERKRRLATKQVELLEKSFVTDTKLDPERKEKLAKELGLKAKQVAIWFQNRRARYKNKQLEGEYSCLKASYDRLKYDYESIIMEKEKLQNEVELLKRKLAQKENNSNPTNNMLFQEGLGEIVTGPNKQAQGSSSTKSDIIDYESPYFNTNNNTCTQKEAYYSTLMCDSVQQLDLSPDDEEHFMMSRNLLRPQTPPTFNNFFMVGNDGSYDPTEYQTFRSW